LKIFTLHKNTHYVGKETIAGLKKKSRQAKTLLSSRYRIRALANSRSNACPVAQLPPPLLARRHPHNYARKNGLAVTGLSCAPPPSPLCWYWPPPSLPECTRYTRNAISLRATLFRGVRFIYTQCGALPRWRPSPSAP
jgi:hypothetical protein